MPSVGIRQDPKILAWAHQTYIDEPSNLVEDLPLLVADSLVLTCQQLVPSLQPPRRAREIIHFEMPFRMTFGCDEEEGEYVRLTRDIGVACVYGRQGRELRMPLKKFEEEEENTGGGPENVYEYTPRRQITHLYKYSPRTGIKPVSLPEYMILLALFHCRTTIRDHYDETGSAREIRDKIRQDWSRSLKIFEWRILETYKTKEPQDCSAADKKAIKKMRKWEWPKDSDYKNKLHRPDSSEGPGESSTATANVESPEEGHGSTSRAKGKDEPNVNWRARETFVESILIYRTQESELIGSGSRKRTLEEDDQVRIAKKLKTRITTRAEKVILVTNTDHDYGSAIRWGREPTATKAT
jgi:hypothetical protein